MAETYSPSNASGSWESEQNFSDTLYDWMERAPWLGISIAAHVVVFMILSAIPWELLQTEEPKIFHTTIPQFEEDAFVELPPEQPEEILPLEDTDEPQLQDAELPDVADATEDFQDTSATGDPDFLDNAPFENTAMGSAIGLGGGGGKFGGRFGTGGRRRGGSGTEASLARGLAWLAKHQDPNGQWDSDGFMKHDPAGQECDGAGEELHDVGMTGLALLALLGDGNTTERGDYRENVARGVAWLRSQQDPDSGLLGESIGHGYLYNHAIASLALCEAYYFSKSPFLKRAAQDAINFITRARNPYGVWRYEYPPNGDNDTSVTGWMVFALKSAEEGGLTIDRDAYLSTLTWLDEMTDSNGRVGYDSPGSLSSRIENVNDHFPPEAGEAMTAVGLLLRFFLDQDPDQGEAAEVMQQHAKLLSTSLPEWNPDGQTNDMYYWYYGSYAMFQMGGKYWDKWNKAMKKAVLDSQRTDASYSGSWDPIGPWGYAGGRVYSTATMVLCLEVYFRYGKLLGGR